MFRKVSPLEFPTVAFYAIFLFLQSSMEHEASTSPLSAFLVSIAILFSILARKI